MAAALALVVWLRPGRVRLSWPGVGPASQLKIHPVLH